MSGFEWGAALGISGIWTAVFYLDRIAKASEACSKSMAGLRYQIEALQKRGENISSDLHAIKVYSEKAARRSDEDRMALMMADLAQKVGGGPSTEG